MLKQPFTRNSVLAIVVVVALGLGVALLLILTTNSNQTASISDPNGVTPTPNAASLTAQAATNRQQIEEARQRWQQQNISNYRLTVKYRNALVSDTFDLTVKNGVVVEPTSQSFETQIGKLSANDYTVAGLFTKSLSLAGQDGSLKLSFDKTYSFPKTISFETTKKTATGEQFSVTSFEALK